MKKKENIFKGSVRRKNLMVEVLIVIFLKICRGGFCCGYWKEIKVFEVRLGLIMKKKCYVLGETDKVLRNFIKEFGQKQKLFYVITCYKLF